MALGGSDPAFDRILQILLERRGLDFNEYRRSFLERRMESRLHALNLKDFASYEKIVEKSPEELSELFDTLTINVAEFFRDPQIWDYLIPEVFTPLVKRGKPIRIWSAGCASGEEPYTIAIAFHEIIHRNVPHRSIKIVATDVDPLALAKARSGIYAPTALRQVSSQRLRIYFTRAKAKNDGSFEVIPEIRNMVQFSEHSYLQSTPAVERPDLVFCRNSMIYLKNESKLKAVAGYHRALVPGGYLILGVTEVLIGETHYSHFRTIPEHPGIFQKL